MMHIPTSETLLRTLAEGEAHVWNVTAHAFFSSVEALSNCLSAAEAERAARLHAGSGRDRFIVTRVALRSILARYLGTSAAELALITEPRGKPVVDAAQRLHFSLSHSREVTLIAVADTIVGVDVEEIRAPRRLEATARRVLHPDTVTALLALPAELRADAFLRAWTQREAHVKAVGGGLFHTPDTLPVVTGSAPDHAVHLVHDRADGAVWSIVRFTPVTRAMGALAARGVISAVRFFDWDFIERV